jgi:hypothetical protein
MKNRFFINNPLLFIIGFIIILTSHSCRKQDNNPSADLASLVDDYHLRYHEHWGERSDKDSLFINMCFFQRGDNVFVAMAGNPFYLYLYWGETSDLRADILGYCKYGRDELGVYDSVEKEGKGCIKPYLKGLMFKDANEVVQKLIEDLYLQSLDFNIFVCVYRLGKNHDFCLVDSGYYHQLDYDDFAKSF